ncbi:hypothetical protein [Mucilaginibacter limnophilus]|nr:hypothetical protein [Mucilaginibacter limnophilus]
MKKELEKKRIKKKQDKAHRKEERRGNSTGGDLENMMAYVNADGDLVSTPEEAAPRPDVIRRNN